MKKAFHRFLGYLYEPVCYYRAKRLLNKKERWHNIQVEELVRILNYARKHCPYYSQLLNERVIDKTNAIDVLHCLPVLDKTIIRTEKVQSDEISAKWRNWANTGGSTGEPLRFPRKGAPIPKRWEHINQMMLYILMGFKPYDKIVTFDGLTVSEVNRQKNIYFASCNRNFPYGIIRYSVLYISKDTIKYYVASLNKEKPRFIRSYPTAMLEFCKLLRQCDLFLNFTPKGCYLTSENFSQQDKDFISKTLGCPVWGQYGHTELSVFAIQDPCNTYYLCSPVYGYTEILDNNCNSVKVGETGNLIVTGFINYGLPFIRYRTGDLAEYGGVTDTGATILSKLLGRDTDFVYDKDNNKLYLVGMIFGAHMHAFDCINSWQIIQEQPGVVNLKIVKGVSFDNEAENELLAFFKKNNLVANLEYVSAIKKTKRGKQKFLIQRVTG